MLFKEHLHIHLVVAVGEVVPVFELTQTMTIPMKLPVCYHSLSTCVVSELTMIKDIRPLHEKYLSQHQVRSRSS